MDLIVFVVIALLLFISALFAASDAALTAASRASMVRLAKQGDARAQTVVGLLTRLDRVLAALLLGSSIATIAATALAALIALAWFGEIGLLYAIGVMSVLVVIFAEVLPKSIALNDPDAMALRICRPIAVITTLLGPLLSAIDVIVRGLTRVLGVQLMQNQPLLSPVERLRSAVDLMHHEGGVEKQDRDMLDGLLDLRELHVSDVMVHRTEMVMINADLPMEELVHEILASEFTRIPLWRDKPENIIGVLHAKDLLRAMRAGDGDLSKIDITAIALSAWFVPEMRPVSEQLKAFRRRKTHFALVVDEYGEVEGLVTLEDILEEIVGDISDEQDVAVAGVRIQPDGSVVVDGSVPIRDLNRAMDWDLPDEEATTLAGLVIHEARSIPERGQNFTFHGFRFRVLRRERNRITALRIGLVPKADADEKRGGNTA